MLRWIIKLLYNLNVILEQWDPKNIGYGVYIFLPTSLESRGVVSTYLHEIIISQFNVIWTKSNLSWSRCFCCYRSIYDWKEIVSRSISLLTNVNEL